MEDATTRLLDLEGVAVARVDRDAAGARTVHVITTDATAAACPSCGVFSTSIKQNATTRPKDLPYGESPLALVWHKRRWRCAESACKPGSFTERIAEVPARVRTTGRLRRATAAAVVQGRSISEVAEAFGLRWPTVQRAVDAHAKRALTEPEPTRVLGMDETRFGSVRWRRDPVTGKWVRTDPWETGIVDLAHGQALLGQVTGRAGAGVIAWLNERSEAFRVAVRIVALDPSAPYAAAVRDALPNAVVAVDHFHLVALANDTVTKVRQRTTREQLGRRGRQSDLVWANRRLMLKAQERLSYKAFTRMWNGCIDHEPTGDLLAAWIAKEELRALMATAARGGNRHDIAHHAYRFFSWCATVDVDEVTTLAETIQTWWPAVLMFLQTGITNAKTEGTNRLVKQVKRSACGFRNRDHYRSRVRLHCARPRRRASARNRHLPAES